MAEAKNTFLKSKMNKDLDDRLLPSGEYRSANNVAVSKSEGQDVGALENVLGNVKIASIMPDFTITVISSTAGSYPGEIYIDAFSSDATTNSNDQRIHVNYEVVVQGNVVGVVSDYSNSTAGVTVSTTGVTFYAGFQFQIRPNLKIIGALPVVSTDRIYLFATNYTDVSTSGLANFSSDAPSLRIAGNYPGNSAILEYNLNTPTLPPAILVEGSWLNFSTTFPILNSNLLETLLFWTDDRNQPRKININTALDNSFTNATQYADGNWGYYNNEDHVSVAKYAPVTPIQLWKLYENGGSPTYETTMKDVVSEKLPDGTTANPDYNDTYGGDPDFLENKFVKFSYRLKFDDGEVSLMAPFTQAAYIPKQDGFFLAGDEDATFRSTVVAFMENKVNNITLRIPMPYVINGTGENPDEINLMQCDQLSDLMKVVEIEILYKESDALAVQVLDRLSLSLIETAGASKYYEYDYQARKPYRTLPSSELIRVFDKIPPRAKTQEVISNRVVYGNYINKLTPPETLNYNVALSDKYPLSDVNVEGGRTSTVEYPQHTVKNNRNYQVAIILSDRYGRSSTPILSEITESISSGGVNFGGSTFYAPYRYPASGPGVNESSVLNWAGDSIKVLFNNAITSTKNDLLANGTGTGTPGIHSYNNTQSGLMVPGGWFSYKVVVRQVEQEYYNIYLPGIINGYPSHTPYWANNLEIGETAFTTLFSDNINKLPRDLSEVGPEQKQYRSSVRLYGRVTNVDYLVAPYNTQYYPGREAHDPDAIGTESELTGVSGVQSNHPSIYQSETNPYIVRLSTDSPIGQQDVGIPPSGASGDIDFPVLAVYETAPTVSRIDIFWETSTSGWLGRLNELILSSTNAPEGITGTNTIIKEDQNPSGNGTGTGDTDSPYITDKFQPISQAGLALNDGIITDFQVFDQTGVNRTSDFAVEAVGGSIGDAGYGFRIKILNPLYYGSNASTVESYNFSFKIATSSYPGETTLVEFASNLTNVAPTITNCASFVSLSPTDTTVKTFTAVNGSAKTSQNANELLFYFENSSGNLVSTIATGSVVFACSQSGVVTIQSGIPSGSYSLKVVVKDAANGFGTLSNSCLFIANFGFKEVPNAFGFGYYDNNPLVFGDILNLSWELNPTIQSFFAQTTGTNYQTAQNLSTSSANGSGLKVDIQASFGAITDVTVNTAGTGYRHSDLITINQTGSGGDGVFMLRYSSSINRGNTTCQTKTDAAYNQDSACGGEIDEFITLGDNEQFVVVWRIYASAEVGPNYAWYNPTMQHRLNSSSGNFTNAIDANGSTALFQGTWENTNQYGNIDTALTSNTASTSFGTSYPGMIGYMANFQDAIKPVRYLMFNEPGEYKLTNYNSQGSGLFVSGTSSCSNSQFYVEAEVESYDGSYDNPACGGGTPTTSFQYRISPSTSSTTVCAVPNINGDLVWAQSYLSKYVVEFYTDAEMLTPYTPTAGYFTYTQTGRSLVNGVIVPSVIGNNPVTANIFEGGNKAYKAQFDSSGIRNSAAISCTIQGTAS